MLQMSRMEWNASCTGYRSFDTWRCRWGVGRENRSRVLEGGTCGPDRRCMGGHVLCGSCLVNLGLRSCYLLFTRLAPITVLRTDNPIPRGRSILCAETRRGIAFLRDALNVPPTPGASTTSWIRHAHASHTVTR
jgi:hypothetical protein